MSRETHFDAIVIGSGFGGSITALKLARAGKSVAVLERGPRVTRDESAWDPKAILTDKKYASRIGFEAPQFPTRRLMYPYSVVGGNSVLYGAASFRLREADFERRSRFGDANDPEHAYADWPMSYADLAPYYDEAEQLLGVVGEVGTDPTEPPRTTEYVGPPMPYGTPAKRLVAAAESLGLQPFPIPLAINVHGQYGRARCIQCTTCDLFPCKIGAKNDLAVAVLPEAERLGAKVMASTVAKRLVRDGSRVCGVVITDAETGEERTLTCDIAVVSAGAIASPKLLLASGLDNVGPNGALIGRYLMRHCSGIVIGLFPFTTNPEQRFHKQVAITDFYFGNHGRNGGGPPGPWGMLQALQVPPPEYMLSDAPFPLNRVGAMTAKNHTYLLCIAEDAPQRPNRVELHPTRRDEFGHPIANVLHRYAKRDLAGRRALARSAARVLRRAGSWVRLRKPIYSFSHAVGTCRFGTHPENAVLDPNCRMFGVDNLFVVDGSFMPTSGGLNPSLTIAANALRVGDHLARDWSTFAGRFA